MVMVVARMFLVAGGAREWDGEALSEAFWLISAADKV
jgi:hypothetical protein